MYLFLELQLTALDESSMVPMVLSQSFVYYEAVKIEGCYLLLPTTGLLNRWFMACAIKCGSFE
jgi:hypothetical protein